MKIRQFIFFLLISQISFANEIDKLVTNEDVNNFLAKRINKKIKDFPILVKDEKSDTSAFGRNKFLKIDIDNNHLTDLLINGKHLMVVLDNGKQGYVVHYLDRAASYLYSTKLINVDSLSSVKKIIIQQEQSPALQFDTLVYVFQKFVEYNPNPLKSIQFEKIIFKTDMCNGSCPVFQMIVNKDRSIVYQAVKFNEREGVYQGILKDKEFNELIEVLKYIKLENLKERYKVNRPDEPTSGTKISYDGKTRLIVDYGEAGTFGLSKLYSLFYDWRGAVSWMGQ